MEVTIRGRSHYNAWWNGTEKRVSATVASDSLRAELMAVPGVASAEVAVGEGTNPAGVKVKLTPDADARRVGAEVQRILAVHGMRSRFSESEPPAVPEVPASVDIPPRPVQAPPVAEIPPVPSEAPPQPAVDVAIDAAPEVKPEVKPEVRPEVNQPDAAPESTDAAPAAVSAPAGLLRSVAVEETIAGLGVIVSLTDGRSASRSLADQADDMDRAVVGAVAEAGGVDAEPVAVEWMELDGGSVVTVVVRRVDGSLAAGAGVVRIGQAFAVGLAAALALEV
jgi:hypothetical protein